MALASKIAGLVQKAIGKLDDLRSYVTYVKAVPGAYNPSTDTLTVTETEYPDVPCALLKLSTEDLDWWPADMKGQKMLVSSLDLPGVVPDDSDHIIDADDVRWNIYRIKEVPGRSVFIIFLREP